MTKKQYEEACLIRTRINMHLVEVDFKDEEAFNYSMALQLQCEAYERGQMTEADRLAYDIRTTLAEIVKRMDVLING